MKKLLLITLCFSLSNVYTQNILHNTAQTNANQSVIVNGATYGKSEDEINRIIVEFNDVPMALTPKALRKTIRPINRSAQLTEYLSEVSKKFNTSLNKSLPSNIFINKEFHKLFSGVQLEVPRKYISYIAGLDYVKKIHIDNQVHIYLDESVPLIKADKVWTSMNNKGKGIRISIIDTGIDYFHEALGQGFGSAYKVIGGHDFVNSDNDPMDDNGHGTHVAGIVAANSSTLKGVAPEASLVGCKALDASGSGYTSTIIEAIEYSIDPNNDGDFSDAVDIINLSLGGYGTPDDPLSTAVNNAAALGVVVCAAAGNNGLLGFFTIGSPGCAEKAITVGNSTKLEILASSSATGPTINNFYIKPDVLAPGTDIKSCKLSGGTIIYSEIGRAHV
jgi:subtilisin family serine protease